MIRLIRTALIALIFLPTIGFAQISDPVNIAYTQMPATGNVVYVRLAGDVFHSDDDCENVPLRWLYLRTDALNFEQIYARVLIAEAQGDTIEIFGNFGSCFLNNNGDAVAIENPYIRFQ